MIKVDDTIAMLRRSATGMRCAALCSALDDLGFRVRDASGGHKVVSHSGLQGFHGTNFNCGHGRNPTVKPVYLRKVIVVLQTWQVKLEAINGE